MTCSEPTSGDIKVSPQTGSTESSKRIAQSVMRLSNYFIQNPLSSTPWHEAWAQEAYQNYYHPLNYYRSKFVFSTIQELGLFDGVKGIYDFGAGLGAASLAYQEYFDGTCVLIEKSRQAQVLSQKISNLRPQAQWLNAWPKHLKLADKSSSALVLSYSFTELEKLPQGALDFKALVFIEPSTQEDGRRLMGLRSMLIEAGFTIGAPCTHQFTCPLLTDSQRDWCHTRIPFDKPAVLEDLEKYLKIKNRTLTLSYLVAVKEKTRNITLEKENLARVVGDPLLEKGKTRVLVCSGPQRKFLSWLKRDQIEIDLWMGKMISLPNHLAQKGNELRLTKKET